MFDTEGVRRSVEGATLSTNMLDWPVARSLILEACEVIDALRDRVAQAERERDQLKRSNPGARNEVNNFGSSIDKQT